MRKFKLHLSILSACFIACCLCPAALGAQRREINIPDFAEAHMGLGISYLMVGDKESAFKEYEILKTLNAQKTGLLLNLINK